jgi:aminoglycoside phosphotransferase (APT) family kinase protein
MPTPIPDAKPLAEFLAQWDRGFADPDALAIEPLTGGASNLTFKITANDRVCVLRHAPPGRKAATAHDMVREARILKAVRPHFPYCPEVYAVCEDNAVLGTPFFVMEYLDGVVPGRSLSIRLTEEQARALCDELIALHVKLHALDLDATGLIEFGKPAGYVKRQVDGWSRRYTDVITEDVPDCAGLIKWLKENQPTESEGCFIHNDFKLDNLVLDREDPTRIVGVLDWEMAALGDPLMDLGASLAYWVQRDDSDEARAMATLPTTLKGMMTRDEVIARYMELSGRSVENFTFYRVYGLFRLAGIAQQIYYRFKMGQSTDPRFAFFGMAVNMLARQAEDLL